MNNYRQCKNVYVLKGETIKDIASKFNMTVDEISAYNKGVDLENLKEGQNICIPEITCPIGSIPYKVKSGETLSSIATLFATTDETILSINPSVDPNNLKVGQLLCIIEEKPDVPSCPSLNIYVVNKGDTLYSIASKFGITTKALLEVNPNIDPYNLIVNNPICLPFTPTPYIIVIDVNTKILNLYYQGKFAKVYPVAVGKRSTPTPLGNFTVMNKQVNPGGPFGTRWMGLSKPSYGIHGTNRPESIGTAASNGCIRMHNNDVAELFSKIAVNTPVIII